MKLTINQLFHTNKTLSKALWITSTGDLLGLFAFAVLLTKINNNPLYAGLVLPVYGFAAALSSLVFPSLLNRIDNKKLLIFSQLTLGLSAVLVAFLWTSSVFTNNIIVISFFFFESFLSQLFTFARETYSKRLEETTDLVSGKSKIRLKLQSQIETGYLAGVFGGPLLFLVLTEFYKIPPFLIIALNAVSFFIAAFMCLRLPNIKYSIEPMSIFKPLKYINKNHRLLFVFVFRVFFLFVSLSLFSTLMFPLISENFKLNINYSSIVYSIIAAGALIGIKLTNHSNFSRIPFLRSNNELSEINIAITGNYIYAIAVAIFASTSSLAIGAIACVFAGIANGLQKVSTRSIMRSESSSSHYAEIISLEFLLSNFLDLIVTALFFALTTYGVTSQDAIYFAGFWLVAFTPFFLMIRDEKKEIILVPGKITVSVKSAS